jgi:hypothetical protein
MTVNCDHRSKRNRGLREFFLLVLLISALLLLLAGCKPTPTPPPGETAQPSATATSAPAETPAVEATPAATPTAEEGGALPEPLAGLAALLPDGWRASALTGDELAALADGMEPAAGTMAARYTSAPDDAGAPAITVLITPREELDLDAYLAQVIAMLEESEGVTVDDARLDYALRKDGAPVAQIRYATESPSRRGVQVAMLDEAGDRLIIITLAGDNARFMQAEPLLGPVVEALAGDEE